MRIRKGFFFFCWIPSTDADTNGLLRVQSNRASTKISHSYMESLDDYQINLEYCIYPEYAHT